MLEQEFLKKLELYMLITYIKYVRPDSRLCHNSKIVAAER